MKKGILFVAVVFAASFASCKKDYACACNGTEIPATTKNETKKDADERCDAYIAGVECEAVKQ